MMLIEIKIACNIRNADFHVAKDEILEYTNPLELYHHMDGPKRNELASIMT